MAPSPTAGIELEMQQSTRDESEESIELSIAEFDKFTNLFNDLDRNRDGVIDFSEFQHAMEKVAKRTGKEHTVENVVRMFGDADLNGDGFIDYEEWIEYHVQHKRSRLRPEPAAPGSPPTTSHPREAAARQRAAAAAAAGAPEVGAAPTTVDALRGMLAQLSAAGDESALTREAARLLHHSLEEEDGARASRASYSSASNPWAEGSAAGGGGAYQRRRPADDAALGADALHAAEAGALTAEGAGNLDRVRRLSLGGALEEVDPTGEGLEPTQSNFRRAQQQAQVGNVAANATGTQAVAATGTASGSSSSIWQFVSSFVVLGEIFVNQLQFNGLTNVVMLNMFANWDLSVEPPAFFASWGLSLGWMDAFNIDLTGVAVLLDRILEACGEQCTQAFLKRMRDDFVSAVEGMPFSTVYLTLTAVLPLLISFFVLLMYRNFFQVVWLFLFILGWVCFLAGIVTQAFIWSEYVKQERFVLLNPSLSTGSFWGVTITGVVMISVCLLWWVSANWWTLKAEVMRAKFRIRLAVERSKGKDFARLKAALERLEKKDMPGAPKSPFVLLRSAVLCAAFLVVSQLRAMVKSEYADDELQAFVDAEFATVLTPVTEALMAIAGVCFGLHFVLCLFEAGRKKLSEATALLNGLFVSLFILILSVLYTAITKNLLLVFNCIDLTCPKGSWYPTYAHSAAEIWSTAININARFGSCETCNFFEYDVSPNATADGIALYRGANTTLGLNASLAPTCAAFPAACAEESKLRVLAADNSLNCATEVMPFYWPASVLSLIGYTVLVPYLFYKIVRQHTEVLNSIELKASRNTSRTRQRTGRGRGKELADACCSKMTLTAKTNIEWDYKVMKSRNRAKTLYMHFEYRYRYFRLAIIVQKLLLVVIVNFIAGQTNVSCALLMAVHFLFLVVAVKERPYFNAAGDALNSAAALACFLNPLLVLLTYHGALNTLSQEAGTALLLFVNFGLPLVFLTFGCVCACRHRSRHVEAVNELEHELRSKHQKQYTKYTTELHKRDRDLNTMTLRTLAEIFMAMAFFAFMAIFVLIIGRFVASSAGNVVPSTPESLGRQFLETHGDPECVIEDKMANVEFIGYGSWDAFSSACCCRDRNDTAAGEVELWTCPDRQEAGAVMHKQRTRVGVVEGERRSALHLRAFCAAQFEPGVVGPSYNATAKAYGVRNATDAGAEEWLLLW